MNSKIKGFAASLRTISFQLGMEIAKRTNPDDSLEQCNDEILALAECLDEIAEDTASVEDDDYDE